MLIIALVQRRLILVTIDELHLCTKQQWGGRFRPAMGMLHILRNRLPDHVPLLGVTATLTRAMYREVVASAGFRKQHLDRHPINRPNAFYNFEATADSIGTQKRVVLLIANATKSQYQYNASKLTKSLFFVTKIGDTIDLKRSIIIWLTEFGFTEAGVIPYIEVYHGDLSDATRRRKQRGFETGTIRILVCTIAFAIGVNPRGVQLVCQIGRCPPEDAIQKGGRGGRGGDSKLEEPSFFIWIVPSRILGARASRLGVPSRRARVPLQSEPQSQTQPTLLQSTTVADLSGYESDASLDSIRSVDSIDYTSTSRKQTKPTQKRLTDEEWRAFKTFDGEWELWNSGGCFRNALLRPFDEVLSDDPAYNCNACNAATCLGQQSLLPLLPADVPDEATNPQHKIAVKEALEALRTVIGKRYLTTRIVHPFAYAKNGDPGMWIIQPHDLRRFVLHYPAVARGQLFKWQWEISYGNMVVATVRKAIGLMPLAPPSLPVATPLPTLTDVGLAVSDCHTPPAVASGACNAGVEGETAPQTPSTDMTVPARLVLRDITNTIRRTPRGAVSKKKRKGDGLRRRMLQLESSVL
jgi:hypothetical protein